MIPLLFFPQAATAPVGGYGGITLTQSGSQWQATAWYGGNNLKSFVQARAADALQSALIVVAGYTANLTENDPDN